MSLPFLHCVLCALVLPCLVVFPAWGGQALQDSTPDQPKTASPQTPDPFSDVAEPPAVSPATQDEETRSWMREFFTENFGFRKEIFSQFEPNERVRLASRQSLGFEALKKFRAPPRRLRASISRAAGSPGRYNPVLDDMMGASRLGWAFEYHNLYLDLYNVFNPLLSDKQRSEKRRPLQPACRPLLCSFWIEPPNRHARHRAATFERTQFRFRS